MKRLLLMGMMAGVAFSSAAHAATKPTDIVQVLTWTGGPSEENMVEKRYTKAWKDLTLDASTRQKIMKVEKELEAKHSTKFRLYALRVDRHVDGKTSVGSVIFLSAFAAVAYDLRFSEYCALHIDGNGSIFSGSGSNGACGN